MNELILATSFTELHSAIERARMQLAAATNRRWVAASVNVPCGRAEQLLDLRLTEETVYFRAGAGSRTSDSLPPPNPGAGTFVGLGAALRLQFEGEERFLTASTELPAAFAELQAKPDELDCLRFFGGGAFSSGRIPVSDSWSEFGDTTFILPQVTYVDDGSQARLILLVGREQLETHRSLMEQVLSSLLDPQYAGPDEPSPSVAEVSRHESVDVAKWSEMISSVRAHIARGDVQKVVAARRTTIQLTEAPCLSRIVRNLNQQAPLCTQFVLRLGDKCFLGATPERLIRKQGEQVSTEALAGSIDASLADAHTALLSSKKDRAEHEYVVRAIEAVLEQRCSMLTFANEPEVRSLKRILHLRTPMTGKLKGDTCLLELVHELHPTPAVGGVPRAEALSWILENESIERGWYASPFGWLDSSGNGEFVVALRSALIHGDCVHIFAGAGIVEGSDADAEFEETALKLTGMVGALGLAG